MQQHKRQPLADPAVSVERLQHCEALTQQDFFSPGRTEELDVRRWETATRWYEARVVYDLLGDWTIVRRWGGKQNRRVGQMVEVATGYPAARQRLERIGRERSKRPVPYSAVG